MFFMQNMINSNNDNYKAFKEKLYTLTIVVIMRKKVV